VPPLFHICSLASPPTLPGFRAISQYPAAAVVHPLFRRYSCASQLLRSDFRAVTRKEGAISVQSNHPPAANTVSSLGRCSLGTVQPVASSCSRRASALSQIQFRLSLSGFRAVSQKRGPNIRAIEISLPSTCRRYSFASWPWRSCFRSSFASPWLPCC
jgi:hypothetical protein